MVDRFDSWRPTCKPPKGLSRPVRVDPAGASGPTRAQSRSSAWRQTSYGFYVPGDVDGSIPEQRIVEQSVRLPEHGAVTGWASCRMRGAAFFDGLEPDGTGRKPVPLAIGCGTSIRADDRVAVSRERLDAAEVTVVNGVPCTKPRRAVFDEMRAARDVREAVVAMDMMAAAELVSISQMRAHVAAHAGWRGVPQARLALDLADEGSRSPNETRLRLIWVLDAGLPPPLVNAPVFDPLGNLIGIADLLDPVAGVVGEYDGAAHRGIQRHHRDVRREDLFRRAGLEYFKVVGLDLLDPTMVVDRMLTTRSRAKFATPAQRAWTLIAPDGWHESPEDFMTLDERLEFRASLRGGSDH